MYSVVVGFSRVHFAPQKQLACELIVCVGVGRLVSENAAYDAEILARKLTC